MLMFRTIACVAFAALCGSALAGECADLRPQAKQLVDAGDIIGARSLFPRLREVCDAAFLDVYGRRIAGLMFVKATKTDTPDEQLLNDALQYGRPWQLLATLGDVAADRKNWTLAARHYQDAVSEINNPQRTVQPPSEDIIRMVYKKAETTRLLASEYVETSRGINGENEGLALSSVRGIAITKVAMPVQFIFGKTELTDDGLKAAKDLADFLKNDKTLPGKGIKLIGHTDPVGGVASNKSLSLKRAEALADYLRANGVTVPIATDGKGKDEPYVPDQASKYTQEQLYRMDRRVELVRQ